MTRLSLFKAAFKCHTDMMVVQLCKEFCSLGGDGGGSIFVLFLCTMYVQQQQQQQYQTVLVVLWFLYYDHHSKTTNYSIFSKARDIPLSANQCLHSRQKYVFKICRNKQEPVYEQDLVCARKHTRKINDELNPEQHNRIRSVLLFRYLSIDDPGQTEKIEQHS